MNSLVNLQCKNITKEDPLLSKVEIDNYMASLKDWKIEDNNLKKNFSFKNYYQTLAFVNAIGWIIHQQNHHPDVTITYNLCKVAFTTHSINALSINDFICAAKIEDMINNNV